MSDINAGGAGGPDGITGQASASTTVGGHNIGVGASIPSGKAGTDAMASQWIPAFRFAVDIEGERIAAFTECTLPSVEWDAEEIKEGGLNTHLHTLPGRRKSARISLKNGVGKNKLMQWFLKMMSGTIERKPVTIILMDETHKPVLTWDIQDAFPIKWTGPQLKADSSAIAVQTLDLVCGEVTIKEGGG